MTIKLNVAERFTPMPIGRYRTDNPEISGQVFREEILVPMVRQAIQEKKILEVDFEGMEGLNASFLDEAFAGLVRSGEWTAKQVLQTVRFVPEKTHYAPYIQNVKEFIQEAEAESGAGNER